MKKRLTPNKKNQARNLKANCNPTIILAFIQANPRMLRAIHALLKRPVAREELDRITGASNGPQLVSVLRTLGLEIPCRRESVRDRDGLPRRRGIYSLSRHDLQMLLIGAFLAGVEQ